MNIYSLLLCIYIYMYSMPIACFLMPISHCLLLVACAGKVDKDLVEHQDAKKHASNMQNAASSEKLAVYETWSRDVVVFTRVFF